MANSTDINKKSAVQEQREKRIKQVMEKSGLKYEEARSKMENARKNYGIKYGTFLKNEFWKVEDEDCDRVFTEFKQTGENSDKSKDKVLQQREKRAREAAEISRFDLETMTEMMENARKNYGIRYGTFFNNELWNIPKDKQEQVFTYLDKGKFRDDLDACIVALMIDRGMTAEDAEKELDSTIEHLGISYADYFRLEFYKLSFDEQRQKYSKLIEESKTGSNQSFEEDILSTTPDEISKSVPNSINMAEDAYEENKWLEKYEIKHLDYDPVKRSYIGMQNVNYEPLRYKKEGECWVQKGELVSPENRARVMITGDITCFERQMYEARVGREDYDFDYAFEKVAPIFNQADLVVGNLETMLSPSSPYRFEQYVCEQDFACNGPVEFLDAIYKAGFDVMTNANNHNVDTGAVGIGETIDNIERFGFIHTGTFKTDKKRYEMIKVNGIKIAIAAFATDQNGKEENFTQDGIDFLLNWYTRERAETIIEDARSKGADFVIAMPHWGKENVSEPIDMQYSIAEELADLGYDCIVGSHAHVLQPFEILHKDGKEVPVFMCTGNFISHNVDNKKSRTIVACLDIEINGSEKSLKCSYIPMYTSEYCGEKKYVIVPLSDRPESVRNMRRLERIKSEVGDEIEINKDVKYREFVEKRFNITKETASTNFDKSQITEYPFVYDSGKFVYDIYEDHAVITKITDGRPQVSYTTTTDILEVPVTGVAPFAMENHPFMKKIKFMDNITCVEEGICRGCQELEGIRLGNKTEVVKKEAFADCPKLMCVVLKRTVQDVESRAFANCKALRSVKVPDGVKHIADDAFEGSENAIFFCPEGSYGYEWAKAHGFQVKHMDIYR